jgi:hypothetical protein
MENKNSEHLDKELIVSLIKDDLTNTFLVSGLEKLGLGAEKYQLHLTDAIFYLMGISDSLLAEDLLDDYFHEVDKIEHMDIIGSEFLLTNFAGFIYDKLTERIRNFSS